MKPSSLKLFALVCTALLAGCTDSSSESETQCTPEDFSQCAPNQVCSENGKCVDAQQPVEVKCGNNVVDGNDWCDGTDLNGRTCTDFQGFVGGSLKCDASCQFDTSACTECSDSADCANRTDSKTVCENSICVMPPHCGDNIVNNDEECDGSEVSKTCQEMGFVGGVMACNQNCQFDDSGCVECTKEDTSNCAENMICSDSGHCVDPGHEVTCGDSLVEEEEECDTDKLNGKSCADMGFGAGTLKCSSSCVFDTSECVECDSDIHCAKRSDRKTKCENHVCVKPAVVNEPECTKDKPCKVGFYCHENASMPELNKCEAQPVCEVNGCLDDQTLCYNVNWNTPGMASSCPNGCKDNKCTDTVCVAGMCLENAYCNTSNKPEGEWVDCERDQTCSQGACVKKTVEGLDSIVISQIYPGGGGSGSTFNVKYVELFNRGDVDVTLKNWSIQYASATTSVAQTSSVCSLPEQVTIPAHSYYLVSLNNDGGNLSPVSDYNCTRAIGAAQSNGRLFLVAGNNNISSAPAVGEYVDAVGYGSSTWAEGSAMEALSKTTAGLRKLGGCIDTNDNSNDFEVGTPSPRNSKSDKNTCQYVEENTEERCKDNIDNDGDSKIDCNDPGCAAFAFCQLSENTETACKDNIDNDNNGKIDCNDPGCAAFAFCQLSENTETACKDGLDNDNDGKKDCDDPDCSAFSFCHAENTAELCKDGIDNDGDGKIDCADSDCASFCVENTAELCKDGVDNDGDGKKDCADSDCSAFCVENTEELCKDGLDNDGDGKIDCDDPDCASFCQGKCGTNQTWLAEYEVCAWNISSAADLTALKDKWNSTGSTSYITDSGKPAAFVLTKNIPLGTVDWVGIGTESKPFNGIFYGNDYTITGVFSNTPGLFNYTKSAIIAHTKLKITYKFGDYKYFGALASQASNITVLNVESDSDLTDAHCYNDYRYYAGLIGYGYGSIKDVNVTSRFEKKCMYTSNYFAGFIGYVSGDMIATNVKVASSFNSLNNINFEFSGLSEFILSSSKSKFNNVDVAIEQFTCDTCDGNHGYIYGLIDNSKAPDVVMDGMNVTIKKFSKSLYKLNLIMGSNNSQKLNISDMKLVNNSGFNGRYFNEVSNLTVINSDLGVSTLAPSYAWEHLRFYNSQIGIEEMYKINDMILYNTYLTTFKKSSSSSSNYTSLIFYDSIYPDTDITFTGDNSFKFESDEKTVKLLNENLKNSIYLPEGKYAPWALDASGNATLDLDAPADQWVEF